MKKISLLIAFFLSVCFTGCSKNDGESTDKNSKTSDYQTSSEETNGSESSDEITFIAETSLEEQEQEQSTTSQNSLPPDVVLNIAGQTLENGELTEITFDENGVWSLAKYDGIAYIAKPSESEFIKYAVGDEICGLKVSSAHILVINDYLDNAYHEEYRPACFAELDGTLTMTGVLMIVSDDGYGYSEKSGNIMLTPDCEAFPLIMGTPENKYYDVVCGNINDNNDILPELSQLTPGKEVQVEITVSNIHLHSAPLAADVSCTIDGIKFL